MVKRRGFSLIELLVAISVTGLLISILLPTLQRVREQARIVACQSNIRQWGLVFSMYAQDNNQKITTKGMDGYWLAATAPYLIDLPTAKRHSPKNELYFCPRATKVRTDASIYDSTDMTFSAWIYLYDGIEYTGSYGFNAWVYDYKTDSSTYQGRPLDYMWKTLDVKGSSNIPLLTACYSGGGCPEYTDEPPEFAGELWVNSHINEMKRFCIDRHYGFVNTLFMDGSASKLGLKKLWQLKWHRAYDTDAPDPAWPEWMKQY